MMSLSQASLAAVLVVLCAVLGNCLAEDTVTIGGVTVSADCALARKEHPRLLFTKADLPRLRERLKHPRIVAELEYAKRLAGENKAGAILLGVLYYLTEEPVYHYRPWTWPPQVVHIGVNAMCAHWQSITPAKFEGENLAVLAAARFHDGLGQWWTDEVISTISMGWGTSALGQGCVWGKLLWYDPDLPPVEPRKARDDD